MPRDGPTLREIADGWEIQVRPNVTIRWKSRCTDAGEVHSLEVRAKQARLISREEMCAVFATPVLQ
jgi:hypothetical protein